MNIKRSLSHPLLRSTVTTTIWSTSGKAVGFLIPFFIAAWFGISGETDVFFFVYGLIMFLTGIFATSIETVIVPFVAEISSEDKNALGRFVGSSLIFSSLGIGILSILFLLFMGSGLKVMTRFSKDQWDLLFRLSVETVPLFLLLSLSSILSGVLNSCKRFNLPAVSPAFRALATLGVIYLLKDRIGVHSIAVGYVLGELLRLVILLIFISYQKIFEFYFSFDITEKLKHFLKTAFYQVVCLSAVGLNPVVDKIMASWLAPGSVSILHYADRLYMIPVTFLSAGLFPVVLSHWASDYSQGENKKAIFPRVKNAAKYVLIASLILMTILLIVRRPMIQLIFARGKFPLASMQVLEWTWIGYLLGLAPYIAGSMFTQAHVALKNTAFLMKAAFLNCLLNLGLNFVSNIQSTIRQPYN